MAVIWKGTNFTGVRYYEHPTRKHGVGKDKYYAIRYQRDGKRVEEGIGWTSEIDPKDQKHWTAEKAAILLGELKEAARGLKQGEVRLSARRDIEDNRRAEEKAEKERKEKEGVTFGDFMTKTYLPQCKLDKKARTYVNEEVLYRLHLADTIGTLPFGKIAPFHLERIKKSMADQKKSDRTIQYALQLTRQGFNTARKLGVYVGESPTKGVKWPKPDNMKLRYLSISESEKLLKALAAKSQSLHDLALLSLHCGIRFGEIAVLTWSCWNREAGTLAILNAKTGSRTAYLTDRAKEMLQARKKAREAAAKKAGKELKSDELIFPKRTREGGVAVQASKVFADTVKELGFNQGVIDRKQRVTFHTLRHSMATHLYEAEHDLYLVQRSLGHATGTMTARYAKMSESRLREGAAALGKVFAANSSKQTEQPETEQAVSV
jgi:site-specific recombinase XerD